MQTQASTVHVSVGSFIRHGLSPSTITMHEDLLMSDEPDLGMLMVSGKEMALIGVVLCLGGTAKIAINGCRHDVEAGRMCVVVPGDSLQVESCDSMQARAVCLTYDFFNHCGIPMAARCDALLRLRRSPVVSLRDSELEVVCHYMALLRHAVSGADMDIVSALLKAFLTTLVKRMLNDEVGEPSCQDGGLSDRASEIYREFSGLLDSHGARRHSVEEYASMLGVSSSYLSRMIRSVSGRNPSELMQQRLVRAATDMLRNSRKSVKETAYELGFPSQSSFNKFFMSQLGCTPMEYKRLPGDDTSVSAARAKMNNR